MSNEGYVNHTPEEDLDTDSGRSAHGIRRFKDTVFRHWVIVLIPVIVLPIVALGVGSMSKKNPTVVTNVWVSQDSLTQLGYVALNTSPAGNAQAELTELLQTQAFDLKVARLTPLYWSEANAQPFRNIWIVKDLSKNVHVAAGGSNLLSISYSPKNILVGTQLLQSMLKVAPGEIQRLYVQQSATHVAFLSRQLQHAQVRLTRATLALGAYMKARHIGTSQIALQTLVNPSFAGLYQAQQTAQGAVRTAKTQLNAAQPTSGLGSVLAVLDAPTGVPAASSKKTLVLDLAIGLILGIMLSAAFVVVATIRDKTLRYPDELPAMIGLPALASFPYKEGGPVRAVQASPPAERRLWRVS